MLSLVSLLPDYCVSPPLVARPRLVLVVRVDPFGDNVMSVSNIPGDCFRTRHDKIKTVLNRFCLTSNIRAECEVFGLFKDLIPVEALEQENNLQRGRGRQGLLPDFKLELPSSVGQPEYQLAELKVIGAVDTWYKKIGNLARRKKGVERRKRRSQKVPSQKRTYVN